MKELYDMTRDEIEAEIIALANRKQAAESAGIDTAQHKQRLLDLEAEIRWIDQHGE